MSKEKTRAKMVAWEDLPAALGMTDKNIVYLRRRGYLPPAEADPERVVLQEARRGARAWSKGEEAPDWEEARRVLYEKQLKAAEGRRRVRAAQSDGPVVKAKPAPKKSPEPAEEGEEIPELPDPVAPPPEPVEEIPPPPEPEPAEEAPEPVGEPPDSDEEPPDNSVTGVADTAPVPERARPIADTRVGGEPPKPLQLSATRRSRELPDAADVPMERLVEETNRARYKKMRADAMRADLLLKREEGAVVSVRMARQAMDRYKQVAFRAIDGVAKALPDAPPGLLPALEAAKADIRNRSVRAEKDMVEADRESRKKGEERG